MVWEGDSITSSELIFRKSSPRQRTLSHNCNLHQSVVQKVKYGPCNIPELWVTSKSSLKGCKLKMKMYFQAKIPFHLLKWEVFFSSSLTLAWQQFEHLWGFWSRLQFHLWAAGLPMSGSTYEATWIFSASISGQRTIIWLCRLCFVKRSNILIIVCVSRSRVLWHVLCGHVSFVLRTRGGDLFIRRLVVRSLALPVCEWVNEWCCLRSAHTE